MDAVEWLAREAHLEFKTRTATLEDVLRYIAVSFKAGEQKGGPGSGNFGHGGRPGEIGGSGGAGEGGSASSASQRGRVDAAVAKLGTGLGEAPIRLGGEGYNFRVGSSDFKAAGQYDPSTGEVTLYDEAFQDDAVLEGVIAHEQMHSVFNEVENEYTAEMNAIILHDKDYEWNDKNTIMKGDGTLREGHADEYPVYSKLESFKSIPSEEIRGVDGITSYSRAYWSAESQSQSGSWPRAINETLAEVSRLYATDRISYDALPPLWQRMFASYSESYKSVK